MKPAYYFKTAWRNLTRRKGANFLNILGLGVGLAGCLVIFLILQHEFSYDRYHKNSGRIYQLVKDQQTDHGVEHKRSAPFESISELRNDYPQVRWAELFTSYGSQVTVMKDAVTTGNDKFIEERGLLYAEPELFDLFDVKWLNGNAAVLRENNTVVLCQSVAAKYFGQWQRAAGQYIRVDNVITAKVSGVIADPPTNTDFPFTVVLSYRTFLANSGVWGFNDLRGWGWGVSGHQVYALLPKQVSASVIDKSLPAFVAKYADKMDGMEKTTYFLHPLHEIHFDTRFENNGDHVSSKTSLYTLGFIGILILLMACINFVNLSTALAVTRSREVGVRKVMGSSRMQLGWQVLADTGLVVLLSLSLALLLAQLSLPFIKYISPIEETLTLSNTGTVLFLCAALIVATLLSGLYPALQLSRLNPIEAIRSKITTSQFGGLSLRRVLVVLQFSFSQLLIIATLIAVSQMNYIRNADLGFTKEAVLQLAGNGDSAFLARESAFKQELLTQKDVQSVSFSHDAPGSGSNWETNFGFDHVDADEPFSANMKFGDIDYASTYGLKMAAGHWYTTNDTSGQAVINETMAHKLGIRDPQQAVGKQIRIGGKGNMWRSIVGVVQDFKNSSLKEGVPPNVIIRSRRLSTFTGVRLSSNNLGRSSRAVETIWNKYYPEYAFNSSFMDENIDRFYRQERRLSASYKVYTILAILISSLGLYGLVSFMAVQKTKEVGIRKVLGASVANIVYLFSREFTVLIVLAFLISAPVAYYMMHGWLQDFVYRIRIDAGVFIFAILISVGIAWVTVGYKSVRAALVNPATSLKSE